MGADGWDEGIERVSALGPAYYKLELSLIAHAIATRPHLKRPVPRWTEQLTEADSRPRAELLKGLALLHQAGIADRDATDHAAAQAYIDARTRDLAAGGVKQLLTNLHHSIRWYPPVITVDSPTTPPIDTPSPAGGRGVIIAPSNFATRCGITAGAVSEHPRVLRECGLITTDRSRRSVRSITPTGAALLRTPRRTT